MNKTKPLVLTIALALCATQAHADSLPINMFRADFGKVASDRLTITNVQAGGGIYSADLQWDPVNAVMRPLNITQQTSFIGAPAGPSVLPVSPATPGAIEIDFTQANFGLVNGETIYLSNVASSGNLFSANLKWDGVAYVMRPSNIVLQSSVVTNPIASVPAATYPAGSATLALFNDLNQIRKNVGINMLTQNAALDKSSQDHTNYMNLNQNEINSREKPGNRGFTGIDTPTRAQLAGYPTTFVFAHLAFETGNYVVGAFDNIYYRNQALAQDIADIGIGTGTAGTFLGKIFTTYITYGQQLEMAPPNLNFLGVYPYPGQTAVRTFPTFVSDWQPLCVDIIPPGQKCGAGKGYPISIYGAYNGDLVATSFVLNDGTADVETKKFTSANDINKYLQAFEIAYFPLLPLKANTEYTASFTGFSSGAPVNKTWKFITGN